MNTVLDKIIQATGNTKYEEKLYLVGGALRDEWLGAPDNEDVDIVLEGDAPELAFYLAEHCESDHSPVIYPRFGTAMLTISGRQVELVSARKESYTPENRKPDVKFASLRDDAFRRDFTINTLMRNLHTGETLDLTGMAYQDLKAGLIRTPLDPRVTFFDDPLRMLRAVRFAVRFGFTIEKSAMDAICEEADRLDLMGKGTPVVSAERIKDEFSKILLSSNPAAGLELLAEAGLLRQFLPELLRMKGVSQNAWHLYDVWDHTLLAMRHLPENSTLAVRTALLLHDVGKPSTRSEDERGIHFYEHQSVGAEMAYEMLRRLKYPNEFIREVCDLVQLHMRLGEYRPEWSDSAVKRMIRAVHPHSEKLFLIGECDVSAMNPEAPVTNMTALKIRMDDLEKQQRISYIQSPLDGMEIMDCLGIPPGVTIREAKEYLINEILEGRLPDGDKEAARSALILWWTTVKGVPTTNME